MTGIDDDWLMGWLADFNPQRLGWITKAAERLDGKFQVFGDQYRLFLMLVDLHPEMPSFMPPTLNAAGMAARDILLNRRAELEECARDHELEALKAMAPYADHGFEKGAGKWPPSGLLMIRYLAMITMDVRNNPDARLRAKAMAIEWVEEGRRRWRDGFTANPMGEPVLRQGAAA